MNILWFTWKDLSHPLAGGAERVNEELAKRLARDGHRVLFVVGGFENGEAKMSRDGYEIVRVGNRYTVYWQAYRYYKTHLANETFDVVIDEINTIPFFASKYIASSRESTKSLFTPLGKDTESFSSSAPSGGSTESTRGRGKEKHFLFIHQLCREIWFHQMPFPLSAIGYLLEPIYLRLLRRIPVITVSGSTKQDLVRYGYDPKRISIIREGTDIEPLEQLSSLTPSAPSGGSTESTRGRGCDFEKYPQPTLLSLGAIRSMKQTIDQLRAFEIAKRSISDLCFVVAGDAQDVYGKKFLAEIEKSPYRNDIEYLGRVSSEKKKELMQKSHLIAVTSVKEGWGLIVTEANSQGTPAVVYNADGLRDSVRDGETGLLARENTPEVLAERIVELFKNPQEYERLRRNGWEWSKTLTFDACYEDFVKVISE